MYAPDQFIGSTLNFFNLSINGYPLSFVVWNIFLAVLAVLIARYTVKLWRAQKNWLAAVLSAVWLAFLPNTAYLMTDARHIIGYCPIGSYGNVCAENAWMVLLFFAYAAIGWPAYVLALRPMVTLVKERFSLQAAAYFTVLMSLLSSLGLLIGLVNRFNIWELVTRPLEILSAAYHYISEPKAMFNLLMVFLCLLFLYWAGERIFIKPETEQ